MRVSILLLLFIFLLTLAAIAATNQVKTSVMVGKSTVGAVLEPGAEVEILETRGQNVRIRYKTDEISVEGVIPSSSLNAKSISEEAPDFQAKIIAARVYSGKPKAKEYKRKGQTMYGLYLDLISRAKFLESRDTVYSYKVTAYFEAPDTTRHSQYFLLRVHGGLIGERSTATLPKGDNLQGYHIKDIYLKTGSKVTGWSVTLLKGRREVDKMTRHGITD